jgi:hypothetical protein
MADVFNIERFKEKFRAGGARPNLFRVRVAGVDEKLEFTCRAASIPAPTLGTIEAPFQGRKVKIAGDRTFAEWSITVMNDVDFKIRRQFEVWNNRINRHIENDRLEPFNIAGGFGESYKRDATVEQFKSDGSVICKYNFVGMYPSEIGAIDLAFDTNDTISEFTVTLQYDYYQALGDVAGQGSIV